MIKKAQFVSILCPFQRPLQLGEAIPLAVKSFVLHNSDITFYPTSSYVKVYAASFLSGMKIICECKYYRD